MPRNIIGAPADGDDFFDRERELADLLHKLQNGNHILLKAPRRVGKTSLLHRVRDVGPTHGIVANYTSVGDLYSEGAFVNRVFSCLVEDLSTADRLLARLKRAGSGFFEWVSNLPDRVDELAIRELKVKLRASVPANWRTAGDELLSALVAVDDPRVRVLIVDELPVFIANLLLEDPTQRRARTFLQWFRGVRQEVPTTGSIRWVAAGSIGIDRMALRLRLVDTVNDFQPYPLGAFSHLNALNFLQALADTEKLTLSPQVAEEICDQVQWLIPYYLQMLFGAVRDLSRAHGIEPTRSLVSDAFEELLGEDYRIQFDHWSARLEDTLNPADVRAAKRMLTLAAVSDREVTAEDLATALPDGDSTDDEFDERLNRLLDVLSSDGYLIERDGRWGFRSPLLKGYWRRRYPRSRV